MQQLAKWFVYNVVVEGKKQRRFTNPKGLIIELNGQTMSERIEGTADHEPAFQARCVWPKEAPREQQRETTAIGKSKKEAEANAAKEMLEIYGHEIYNAPAQESAKLKEKTRFENGKRVRTSPHLGRRPRRRVHQHRLNERNCALRRHRAFRQR